METLSVTNFGMMIEAIFTPVIKKAVTEALQAEKAKEQPEKLLRQDEVMKRLNRGRTTVSALTKSGKLKAVYPTNSRRPLYREKDVIEFLNQSN